MSVSCEPVAILQRREYGTERIFIARSRYEATTNKNIEDFVYAVITVIFEMCKSVKLLHLFVVTIVRVY
jgi:hypothetical protein